MGEEPEGVLASPDGKRVYVTSEVASLVHVVDPAAGTVLKNVQVGKRPRRFSLTPDGAELWVTSELGSSVSILSTKDLKVIATLKFDADTPIVINMQEGCVTDASTAASLAQTLVHDLGGFVNIRVSVSGENRKILEKSTGYNLLREYLRFAQES